MIVDALYGNILSTSHSHIVFMVNTGGQYFEGFAGIISDRYWPELASMMRRELGDVLTERVGSRTFHAIVCHSVGIDCWRHAPRYVEECLNKLDVPGDETLGVVLAVSGPVVLPGPDMFAIIGAIARSEKRVIIYAP
ncbi:MAG: hypothetical protein WCT28_03655 [Patescibacteria group bacterium]|jgi:hypothetical protein